MAEDMKETAQKCLKPPVSRSSTLAAALLTEAGPSMRLGTGARWVADPKTSVLNQFQQSHDVKKLIVVDGSAFVNASCQNPTWTIMSLCWRSCDYLADELKERQSVGDTMAKDDPIDLRQDRRQWLKHPLPSSAHRSCLCPLSLRNRASRSSAGRPGDEGG